ncbi:MAG: T9SS type A sorting domain-containing protein [Bacteroidota bacterium]
MKKLLLSLAMISLVSVCSGQSFNDFIDFERGMSSFNYLTIDRISNPGNIWQTGVPGKIIFDSAYSKTHAIVTDTLQSYPVNSSSSFIITHLRPDNSNVGNESLQLNFWFKINTDSLTDFGTIEASIDQGKNWVNLMTQDSMYQFRWMEIKPVLTGNSNGWQHFALELRSLTYELGYSDTLLYRFTFTSDSIDNHKEGWMLDDFQLVDYWEGIDDNASNTALSIVPNPTAGMIRLDFVDASKNNCIEIINNSGQLVFETNNYTDKLIDLSHLKNGNYFLRYFCEKKTLTGKFIISR